MLQNTHALLWELKCGRVLVIYIPGFKAVLLDMILFKLADADEFLRSVGVELQTDCIINQQMINQQAT